MRRAFTLVAMIVAGTTAVPTAARDRAAVPAVAPDGEPRNCIPLSTIHETIVRSDRVIDFRAAGRRTYRVTLPHACPGLGFERRFAYATSLGQLCAQDIITVLYQTGASRGASCGLAPFQPVTLAPAGRSARKR